uniref:NADH-ubiquinone oxidoreductase chain 4 n=1 Tax=Gyge ovalis TaxID=2008693 RepID=A0A343DSC3_9CRUS|nr:NADH dehydrogenase subunit 4 [Gyge ovalis]ASC43030.1 NADH dehydrogenase subunit 4 [Gyge ovalis]
MMIMITALSSIILPKNWPTLSMHLSLATVLAMLTNYRNMDGIITYQGLFQDSISSPLVALSIFITLLSMLAAISNSLKKNKSSMLVLMLALMVSLVLCFSTSNILLFYIMFEASLVPMLLIILGWGYQVERLKAANMLILYTVLASLPLLYSLLVWSHQSKSSLFTSLISPSEVSMLSVMFGASVFIAFLVKLPLYITHLWLPKAHVEAPVGGSMLLAAILLKLGGYGLLRLSPVVSHVMKNINCFVMAWCLVGGVTAGILCSHQTDIKSLIALSSVVHMAFVAGTAVIMTDWSFSSNMFVMISHGLCSSALFFMANLAYERISSRSLSQVKGLFPLMWGSMALWFTALCANMSAPPFLSLLAEMGACISIINWSYMVMPLLMGLNFLPALYSLYMFTSSMFKAYEKVNWDLVPYSLREIILVVSHMAPLIAMTAYPYWMLVL